MCVFCLASPKTTHTQSGGDVTTGILYPFKVT